MNVKVIKKQDAITRLFDDPEWPSIERNIKSLNQFIEQRPERYERIKQLLHTPDIILSNEQRSIVE